MMVRFLTAMHMILFSGALAFNNKVTDVFVNNNWIMQVQQYGDGKIQKVLNHSQNQNDIMEGRISYVSGEIAWNTYNHIGPLPASNFCETPSPQLGQEHERIWRRVLHLFSLASTLGAASKGSGVIGRLRA
ncbi:hypothetical protein AAHA92_33217 [Salvia divinorum]|uniref:Uncharacterized protein n=1 Tax=Salvia divinorum TaxID=28513 RepID=A0ABD1FQX3_SALDI